MGEPVILDEDLGTGEGLRDAGVEAAFAKTRVAAGRAAVSMIVSGGLGLAHLIWVTFL